MWQRLAVAWQVTGHTWGRSLRRELRVGQAERAQTGQDAVELVDARNRSDAHTIQRASADLVLAHEALVDTLRAQALQQPRCILFRAEGAGLDVQGVRRLRRCRRL